MRAARAGEPALVAPGSPVATREHPFAPVATRSLPLWYSPSVHADLEKLIRLQSLDSRAAQARKAQSVIPEQQQSLESRLQEARAAVATASERLSSNQADRRAIEKDLAVVQGRLSRYKDQLMEVKTNREYHAMQHEIEAAQAEVKRFEDVILERMLEADDITSSIKAAESALQQAEREVTSERARFDRELVEAARTVDEVAKARTALVAEISPAGAALYEQVARARRGLGLAEARDGLCVECQMRLRPQVYSEVRRNEALIQCESCLRILYFVPPQAAVTS